MCTFSVPRGVGAPGGSPGGGRNPRFDRKIGEICRFSGVSGASIANIMDFAPIFREIGPFWHENGRFSGKLGVLASLGGDKGNGGDTEIRPRGGEISPGRPAGRGGNPGSPEMGVPRGVPEGGSEGGF